MAMTRDLLLRERELRMCSLASSILRLPKRGERRLHTRRRIQKRLKNVSDISTLSPVCGCGLVRREVRNACDSWERLTVAARWVSKPGHPSVRPDAVGRIL